MEVVKCVGIIIDKVSISKEDIQNDIDHIYLEHKNVLYKFNRYDPLFIKKTEEAIITNPYSHCPGINYEGPLDISIIDDRFTNTKYYTITKQKHRENIDINSDLIIDDLYNNTFEEPDYLMK